MAEDDAVPTDRFEWERIIRRAVIPGPQKLLALTLATYADGDGSRVRPGIDLLAAVTCTSEKTVRRHLDAIRRLGLLQVVARGGGRGGKGKTTQYQLVIPVDLLERVELLTPGERREPTSRDDQAADEHHERPVDNSDSEVTQTTSHSGQAATNDRSYGDRPMPIERSFPRNERSPRRPTTNHLTNHKRPDQSVPTQRESRPRAGAEPRRSPDLSPSEANRADWEAA